MSKLSEQELKIIQQEEAVLAEVLNSLKTQRNETLQKLGDDSSLARTLTQEIMNTRRVEDKMQLASDEAVAHGLSSQRKEAIQNIDSLTPSPYFARITLQEEESGKSKTIEYKLGVIANPDCRIVDWRKAPIAKLYYEYREGDSYFEEILGKEREGTVTLRNTVSIKETELRELQTGSAQFQKRNGAWQGGSASGLNAVQRSADGTMNNILPLISPEQFKLITEDAKSAVLIQGIAGSGKTTVALHRLAWLLHPENGGLRGEDCLIVTLSQALKNYITNVLPSLGITNVKIFSFTAWACLNLRHELPSYFESDQTPRRPSIDASPSVSRVLRSLALLNTLEKHFLKTSGELMERLLQLLSNPSFVQGEDETKLISVSMLQESAQFVKNCLQEKAFSPSCEGILLRALQLKNNGVYWNGKVNKLAHLVLDETQDFAAPELAAVVASVEKTSQLTLVGDAQQRIDGTTSFPGWERLRSRWLNKDGLSNFFSLTVSHRSTLQIMQLADHVQDRKLVVEGRAGRIPLYYRASSESQALLSSVDWLTQAQKRFPLGITAVICRTRQAAKQLTSLLTPKLGHTVRYADDAHFSFESGVVVCAVNDVKGLEFTNVLIWDASAKNYSEDDLGRNALYLAITRAAENLCIIACGSHTKLLPSLQSSLVRGLS